MTDEAKANGAGLAYERVAIDSLREDPGNARVHPSRNLEAIKASLARFGQQKPIVVDGVGTVVAGNGTLRAALELGWTEIDVVRTSLVGPEAVAFALADNKTADLAEWDFQILAQQLQDLPESMRLDTGFADFEIEPLLQADWNPPALVPITPVEPTHVTHFNQSQYDQILAAVEKLKQRPGFSEVTVPDALVVICGEWSAT